MKPSLAGLITQLFFLCLFLAQTGCDPIGSGSLSSATSNSKKLSTYNAFAPVKIEIMPLTEIIDTNSTTNEPKIKIYVSLLDSSNCQSKSAGIFRFELYQYVHRSPEPKGRRIMIWPDINLTDPAENNRYWRDFLRAYEFDLGFESPCTKGCVLQVTCMTPNGKRLTTETPLKAIK